MTVFVYSAGKLAAEYSTAPPEQNPTTKWTVTDQLGSPRVLVDSLGQVVSRRDFMPFGEEITPDGTHRTANLKYNFGDNIRQKFTGYQKDEETQLDFAEARMYQNLHGRFTAVDPLLASGKSANPQTFNRYVYVMNNPLIFTDPDGLQAGTYYQDLGDGRWALANYAKSGYTRYKGPARTGRAPDGTLLRITTKGWRPIDDVVAAKAARSRSNATTSSNDAINTPLLNDLARRGPALLKIKTALAALMVSPAAGFLLPSGSAAGGVAATSGSAGAGVAAVNLAGRSAAIAEIILLTPSTACGNGGGCGDQTDAVRSQLAAIYEQYPANSFQCDCAAQEGLKVFQEAGLNGEIVQIENGLNNIVATDGTLLSDMGFHQVVRVEDRYYDALTGPGGATWEEYEKLIQTNEFRPLTRTTPRR